MAKVQQNLINESIEDALNIGKKLIEDKKKVSITDFLTVVEAVEEYSMENFQAYTNTQIKSITLKALEQLKDFTKEYVDEDTYRIIETVMIGAPTLYDMIERALLKNLDTNGDGQISMDECCSCFGK